MITSERIAAFLSYLLLPVGWLYVFLFGRRSALAVFHCRQAIMLVAFVVIASAVWAGVTWLLAWIPLGAVVGIAFFSLVMAAWAFGVIAWLIGMVNALRGQMVALPIVGGWVNRLPL
jgi:uncharacterized membrane protein